MIRALKHLPDEKKRHYTKIVEKIIKQREDFEDLRQSTMNSIIQT